MDGVGASSGTTLGRGLKGLGRTGEDVGMPNRSRKPRLPDPEPAGWIACLVQNRPGRAEIANPRRIRRPIGSVFTIRRFAFNLLPAHGFGGEMRVKVANPYMCWRPRWRPWTSVTTQAIHRPRTRPPAGHILPLPDPRTIGGFDMKGMLTLAA